jgi:hypothetical protein
MRADAGCVSRRASTSPQSQALWAAHARQASSIPGGVAGQSHRVWAHPPETAGASTRLAPEGPRATHSLHHTAERGPPRRRSRRGAATVTVTKHEILYSLNKPEDFMLAIVEFLPGDAHRVHYVRRPFQREPDFGVTSVNYDFAELLARADQLS